jgi:1-acyl-sn-glycerol-3-phosphate acyltransferase
MCRDSGALRGDVGLLYRFLRFVFVVVIKLMFNVKVRGMSGLPKDGPFVICSNHTSWWDPVLLAALCPREIHFIAKKELFRFPVFGLLLRRVHAFPVDRKKADVRAVREALSRLGAGKVLGIFPEGTRNKGEAVTLGTMHGGAALFAIKSKVPVLPVAIRGEYRFRKPLLVSVGNPMDLTPNTGRLSTDIDEGSKQIAQAISGLYHDPWS